IRAASSWQVGPPAGKSHEGRRAAVSTPRLAASLGEGLRIGEFAAAAVGADEVRVAEIADRPRAISLTAGPEIATCEAAENGRPPSLRAFALQRVEDFLHRIHGWKLALSALHDKSLLTDMRPRCGHAFHRPGLRRFCSSRKGRTGGALKGRVRLQFMDSPGSPLTGGKNCSPQHRLPVGSYRGKRGTKPRTRGIPPKACGWRTLEAGSLFLPAHQAGANRTTRVRPAGFLRRRAPRPETV